MEQEELKVGDKVRLKLSNQYAVRWISYGREFKADSIFTVLSRNTDNDARPYLKFEEFGCSRGFVEEAFIKAELKPLTTKDML